jgi:tetratricopeptide (TPR) repeat protein
MTDAAEELACTVFRGHDQTHRAAHRAEEAAADLARFDANGDGPNARAAYKEECAAHKQFIADYPQDVDAHFNMGNSLHARGDPAGSADAYRAAIAADPQHAKAHFNLGILLEAHGQAEEAVIVYRAGIAADPQQPKAHFNLGGLLRERGDLAGAETAYCAAIAADPQYDIARIALDVLKRPTWVEWWVDLKDKGWTRQRRGAPMDFWYLRPGLAKLVDGKLGRDYFESKDAVVEFVAHNGAHWHDACLRHPHYSLGQLWSMLKAFGWTCKKAGRSMPLLDHVWLPPGADHVPWQKGERGVDWFGGHDELNELITSIRAT